MDFNKYFIKRNILGMNENKKFSHSGSVYDWLGDIQKVPLWFEYWMYKYQDQVDSFVIKDRASAIKIGIANASKDDIVLILKRDESIIINLSSEQKIMRYFLDDLSESRKTLKKISLLYNIPIKTNTIPWKL